MNIPPLPPGLTEEQRIAVHQMMDEVAKAEREACAKIAEDYGGYQGEGSQIAAEIRARKA